MNEFNYILSAEDNAERCEDKESSGYNELKTIVSQHFPEYNIASFVNMVDESINKRNRSVHSIKDLIQG